MQPYLACQYYDYQLSKVQQKFFDHNLTFNLCCCHGKTCSVSSGNLSACDVIGSKECEIAGSDVVTMIGNKESYLWQHCNNFKSKTL